MSAFRPDGWTTPDIEREGVGRDGEPGQAYSTTTDDADLAAFEERGREDRHLAARTVTSSASSSRRKMPPSWKTCGATPAT